MVCRLCLEESNNNFAIFFDNGESEVAKIIAKYFRFQVQLDDISGKICVICWQHLFDFHRFWLSIDRKQKTLQTHLACTQIKQDVDDIETAELPTILINSPIDSKSNELLEPEIDMAMVKSNLCADGIEFEEAELTNDETSMDRDSIVSLLDQPVDEIAPEKVIETISTRKRKSIKTMAKRTNSIKERNFNNTVRSAKGNIEKKEKDEPDLMLNDKREKKQDAKALKEDYDKFIAENAQLSCCLCSVPLKDFNDLKKHFRQVHDDVGYIPCCNNRYNKRGLYIDHLKLHMNPDHFKCTLCNKQLASRNNYKNHMNTKHPDTEKLIFSCKSCPRKFAKQYILDYHLKYNHITERNFICKTCKKGFINSASLRQHEKVVHLSEYDSVCEVCGKCLKTAQNLLTHMEDMHGTEPRPEEQCKICFRWLKNSRCLKKHMMAHRDKTSGQKYKCLQCQVEKNTKPALAAHIRYHHSGRLFTCAICNKEFKDPRGLREHETTHTGTHLYTCPFCPKTFRSYGNMHKHKVNSHSQEWVRCWSQPNEITKSLLNIFSRDGEQS